MSGARVTGESEPWFASSAVCTLPVWSSSYIDCMYNFWILGVTCLGVIYILVCVLARVWAIIYSIYKKTTIHCILNTRWA